MNTPAPFGRAGRLLLGLALASLPAGVSAQQIVAKRFADVSGWTVQSYGISGSHMRCGAVAPGAPGSFSSFEKSSEGWTLVVRTKAKGDSVKGTVDIDGRSAPGEFVRMDDDRVGLFLKAAQIDRIRAGKQLTVAIAAEQTAVPLAGIAAVLRKVAECDDKGGS